MGKKEFDFEKALKDILEQAEKQGLADDMVFQTLLEEFRRTKGFCDELYRGIKEQGAFYKEKGSMGQDTFKSNPLNKDYVSMQKQLIATCDSLKEKLANISSDGEEDNFPY